MQGCVNSSGVSKVSVNTIMEMVRSISDVRVKSLMVQDVCGGGVAVAVARARRSVRRETGSCIVMVLQYGKKATTISEGDMRLYTPYISNVTLTQHPNPV